MAREQRALDQLDERLGVLVDILELGEGRLPDATVARAAQAELHARTRLGHGTTHTVVALAGATGSGKSSLFNAIAGTDLAQVGVTRPTTSKAQAVVFSESADRLLDWLDVPRRHLLDDATLTGLVLLDLPDHDSTAVAHRIEVDRLVQVVDVFLWVVDPQKYADAALHEGYLRRFASHGSVTLVALNQIDRLSPAERRACIDDLGRLLVDDGLSGVRILPTSATTGEGVAGLRGELAARTTERRALIARLQADLDWVADDLVASVGDVTPAGVDHRLVAALHRQFAQAAGVEAVADAVGAAHRYRAGAALGWPPIRWVRKFRPDPLKRLGLDKIPVPGRSAAKAAADAPVDHSAPIVVSRTSRKGPSPVAEAAVATAVDQLCRSATEGIPEPLRERTVAPVLADLSHLNDRLDTAVATAPLPATAPRWWRLINLIQWAASAVMAVGVLWLTVIFLFAWLGIPELPKAMVTDSISWPTALALGGALAGILIAVLGRLSASVGAARRAARARDSLTEATNRVADAMVVDPLNTELVVVDRLGQLTRRMAR
jgi:energy-coupling factor transporter ATP-binding protein EcfA2